MLLIKTSHIGYAHTDLPLVFYLVLIIRYVDEEDQNKLKLSLSSRRCPGTGYILNQRVYIMPMKFKSVYS